MRSPCWRPLKGGRIDTYSFVWHQSCCSCISQLHQFLITSSTNIAGFSGGTRWEHAKTSPEKCSNSLHNLMCPAADTRLDLLLGVCFVFPNGVMSILKFHPQRWIGEVRGRDGSLSVRLIVNPFYSFIMLKAKQFELLPFCLGLCLEDKILIACANFEAYKWAFGANGCSEFLHQRSAGIGKVVYRSFIAFLHFLYAKNTPPNFE